MLPYASEVFGVYQPLIGWTSKRQRERLDRGFRNDLIRAERGLLGRFTPSVELRSLEEGRLAEIRKVRVAQLEPWRRRSTGTLLGDLLSKKLPDLDRLDEAAWDVIDEGLLDDMLARSVVPEVEEWQRSQLANRQGLGTADRVAEQLARESSFAGLLVYLRKTKQFDALKDLFFKVNADLPKLQSLLQFRDPLDHFDPKKDIDRAALSPIGIVHLFRQYFFEFDTFLGSPVGHVWLSPGSVVELVEVSTRRTLVEKVIEQATESVTKTEKSLTEEEEISDAVKQENRSDTKFGMNATVNQGWITGSATATASLNMENTQSTAREHTHRQMRQQSQKLSTEIRKNFKSTFRTVTETIDTSSKRYVLNNTTDKLVNYELRRKMRQVGVQVQDIGTYLCWQTFVDDPGRDLGVAKLVHIAKNPDVSGVPAPESIPRPADHVTPVNVDIPFVPMTQDTEPDEDMDEAYRDGVEVNTDTAEGTPEKVQHVFNGLRMVCDQPGYTYAGIDFDYGGQDVRVDVINLDHSVRGQVAFGVKVRHINFRNNPNVRIVANVKWTPAADVLAEIEAKNKAAIATFKAASKRLFEQEFLAAAQDRINKASRIERRPFEDLREEERIVVYRALIQDMLTRGVPMPDDRTRHVVSELLNTIFDIDKMLYFVAPEWWRPRLHRSHQAVGVPAAAAAGGEGGTRTAVTSVHRSMASMANPGVFTQSALKKLQQGEREDASIPTTSVVAWGGIGENRADNYYITHDSEPARLGASLGWLMQLDGDNMRNAFLNAPWVKAVIPIRPGKEKAAINWLQQTGVEGAMGLDQTYVAPAGELAGIPHDGSAPTVLDAIEHLCAKVSAKHASSAQVGQFPPEEIDDANKVSATPIDKVFEHGFYPLQGGFRVAPGADEFEVFDQWVEVLPTDQVVPVEVKYDPKTGRQV
ncbi:hypothetical protein B0E41_25290 [Hydrogenophaga sp. A37]|nr:hypothetical protein B0E41_25290 [Hydrogenophaga sp. A37]